jgi:4-amino-4-deoxy-L-arabinose transferase-like glycosyltransferase
MTATTPFTPSTLTPRVGTYDASGQVQVPTGATSAHSRRERGALIALLLGTAVLYLWGLGASGYANDFYAAAVQAGTKSWKAMFFGSFDSSNFITVDKPPASLWPMEIAGRIFGFNSWSMLVPQAIEGVLSVWLLYATVRRWFGASAGLLAGALLALTPVAVLMFRFNNPDALMTLLIVAAAYCVTRALDNASTRWLALAGAAIGFSFLAKGLQPFTVLPALALAYLVAAPTTLRRRVLQLLAAGAALIAGAGWWVLIVQLTPASARPYIGGSGDNTALGLALGYNGLSRITGGSGAGLGGGANFSGSTGLGRLFNSLNGGQIAWLLPTALIALVALVGLTRSAPRADRTRAAAIIWGGWLLVTAGVLSFASGIIHTYYSVELAPAIAAVVAIASVLLWRRRAELAARLTLAGGVVVTGWWSYTLLHRTASWQPWIADVVVFATLVGAIALAMPPSRLARRSVLAAGVAVVALAAGPAAYAINTAATAHTGSTPSAGPTVAGAAGGPGGGFGGGRLRGGTGGPPTGGFGGGAPPAGAGQAGGAPTGTRPGGTTGRPTGQAGGAQSTNAALTKLLTATTTKWAAAAIGSQTAGPLELASGKAVIAIGGFSGTDDAPTLAQFEALVANGEVHYFISGGATGGGAAGRPGGQDGQGSGNAISTWVAAHFTSTTVGGSTVYDLTKAATS